MPIRVIFQNLVTNTKTKHTIPGLLEIVLFCSLLAVPCMVKTTSIEGYMNHSIVHAYLHAYTFSQIFYGSS